MFRGACAICFHAGRWSLNISRHSSSIQGLLKCSLRGILICERPKIILTQLEQRSWIKIEMAQGRSAQECFQGPREACGDAALPYRTVARWVKAYQREGDDFLGRIVAMDETWTRSYEPNLKRQSNEWKHPGSPRPNKVRPTQSAVKEMFIVAYDIDGGGQYGTSTKMDALMVYDAFQTFGKRVEERHLAAKGCYAAGVQFVERRTAPACQGGVGQNKNLMILMVLIYIIAKKHFDSVDLKFLVSEHSYMPNDDREFGIIEKRKKKRCKTMVPEEVLSKETLRGHSVWEFNSPGLGRGRPRSTTPEVQEEILEAVNMTP
ncbi:hypothetical protein ANN_26509 [Periplaneta americana]|uniref:Transposase n=1 Tax=Periplaneta americana TaxID=6978 RepID=A0ABQ8RYZ3_PERAM|nr:hypothetical protein ANN_26509 [Periplaneta americana]